MLTEKDFQRIPLKRLDSGHYTCNLKINNRKALFIVDTGASTSCMGLENSALFKLNSEVSEILAAGAGATGMETKVAINNALTIGTLKDLTINLVLFDLSHVKQALAQVTTKQIHGILGADFLKEYRAVIDYGRNCMYLKH